MKKLRKINCCILTAVLQITKTNNERTRVRWTVAAGRGPDQVARIGGAHVDCAAAAGSSEGSDLPP